jgi:hypothetical protein
MKINDLPMPTPGWGTSDSALERQNAEWRLALHNRIKDRQMRPQPLRIRGGVV